MSTPTLSIVPIRPALLAGHDNLVHALVRVTAPEAPDGVARRAPLHLSLVIDRSGSMSGRPIEEAKRCVALVASGLRASDRVSLVTYDDNVRVMVPAEELGNGEAIRRAIAAIRSGGSTNLHGGWMRGAETLAPHAAPDVLSRVILLSDGCANAGLVDEPAIAKHCAKLAEAGVTTSTYGLGHNFNESLMHAMARAGRGNAYYGATADDLMDPFREELSLLDALMARKLTLCLEPADGVQVDVLNDYPTHGSSAWKLPDLAFGAEAWAIVSIRVPKALTDSSHTDGVPLLTARVGYVDLDGHSVKLAPASLALSAMPASAFAAIAEDDLVRRRLREIEAARMADQARGDWEAVDRYLEDLRRAVKDDPWLAGVVHELEQLADQRDEARFGKESLYSSHRMSTRLASVQESIDPMHDSVPDFLRRKLAQGKAAPPSSKP